MVTDACADFVLSATLVAVTAKFPLTFPVTYNPPAEIVPPVAVQFTAVFAVPVTFAVNCSEAPSRKDADFGAIVTLTFCAGAVIVTLACANFVASATLVAVTVKFPATIPATYNPFAEIVPPVAVQFRVVFEEPVTLALNCCEAPSKREAVFGATNTLTLCAGAVIVTLACANFVASATLVAVTVKFPAIVPATYSPLVEIVPPVAVQLTPVFVAPVTLAVNCCEAPSKSESVFGATATLTLCAGALIVTLACANFVASATLVAVTINFPATVPATYNPAEEIVPPVALQVTPVFVAPVTLAENCSDTPSTSEADGAVMATATPRGGGGPPVLPATPTHP